MNVSRFPFLFFLFGIPPLSFSQESDVDPAPQTVISSERLEMENDGQKAFFLFSDNVKMTGNNLIVTCDRLEVHSNRTGNFDANIGKLGSIQKIIALGNVSISQEGRTARAGRVEVVPGKDMIVLTEDPIVTDSHGTVSGNEIIFYRGERRAVVNSGPGGPARVVLPAMPNLGFDNDSTEADPVSEPETTGEPADTESPDTHS